MGFCILKLKVGTTQVCNLFIKTLLSYGPKKCLKWSNHINSSEQLCTMSSKINSEQLNATKKMCESLGFNTVSYDTVKVLVSKV